MDHDKQTPLQMYLQERQLSVRAAAKLCDVSVATMEIVAGGSPTLPCLAIQIGKGLGLTRDEVKPLGKPLQSKNWGKNGLPDPNPIDVNPKWYNELPKKRSDTTRDEYAVMSGYFVDVKAVMNRLLELGMEMQDIRCLPEGKNLRSINNKLLGTRKRYLMLIAQELGMPVEDITTMHRQDKLMLFRFQLDADSLTRIMARPGNGLEQLAQKMLPGQSKKDAVYATRKRLEDKAPMKLDYAARLAAALGAELDELGQRVIVTY